MNKKQIKALQSFTSRVDRSERYTKVDAIGYMNGAIVWDVIGEPFQDGSVMVSGSNVDCRWFETSKHIIVLVGPRGGIRVRHNNNISI